MKSLSAMHEDYLDPDKHLWPDVPECLKPDCAGICDEDGDQYVCSECGERYDVNDEGWLEPAELRAYHFHAGCLICDPDGYAMDFLAFCCDLLILSRKQLSQDDARAIFDKVRAEKPEYDDLNVYADNPNVHLTIEEESSYDAVRYFSEEGA